MHTAAVTINRHPVPHDPIAKGKSPFQLMWPDKTPLPLRVFGSVAYTLTLPRKARNDNLKYPGFLGIMVGYADNSNQYCPVLRKRSDLGTSGL